MATSSVFPNFTIFFVQKRSKIGIASGNFGDNRAETLNGTEKIISKKKLNKNLAKKKRKSES